ncbi:MAG TPA: carboxymuconolactone decarboxylase family protein [Gemmatimonadaceae bacterium]|nr:carboxymuconolactone decarboxylase family protein [Gemmatimonadaceae bacterium]
MSETDAIGARLTRLDDSTRSLVRLAAALAGGSEEQVRRHLNEAQGATPPVWIEELLLQTYLFAGFPRALNGMREWRRLRPAPAAAAEESLQAPQLRRLGETTCATVYGTMYERLRANIRQLHPLMDDWMIVEGYGKVLSRPALDLPRRELCIVAACAATAQDRQLQSHLHGALNAGVAPSIVSDALASMEGVIPESALARARRLWDRIRNDVH